MSNQLLAFLCVVRRREVKALGNSVFRMCRIAVFFALGMGAISLAQANDWVSGNVNTIEETGTYTNGLYGVIVVLSNISNTGNTAVCTGGFKVVVGAQGVTEDIKKRFFSMAMTAWILGKKVSLYVDTASGSICPIQMVMMGDGL